MKGAVTCFVGAEFFPGRVFGGELGSVPHLGKPAGVPLARHSALATSTRAMLGGGTQCCADSQPLPGTFALRKEDFFSNEI